MSRATVTGAVAAVLLTIAAASPAGDEDIAGEVSVEQTPAVPGSAVDVRGRVRPLTTCTLEAFGRPWPCDLGDEGAQGAVTIGDVRPGEYEVHICVPTCSRPWAGRAWRTLTVLADPLTGRPPSEPTVGPIDPPSEVPPEGPAGDPTGAEQAFTVSPSGREEVSRNPTSGSWTRSYTANVPTGTPVTVELFREKAVHVDGEGRVTMSTGTADGPVSGVSGGVSGAVISVQDAATSSGSVVRRVMPVGGAVTFSVSAQEPIEFVPVVYEDENGDGLLGVSAMTTQGRAAPEEPLGVGGATSFVAPAPAGGDPDPPESGGQEQPADGEPGGVFGLPSGTADGPAPLLVLAVAEQEPELQLEPDRAPRGEDVLATAPGLPVPAALRSCELSWNGAPTAQRCELDEEGSLTGTLEVPSGTAPGQYELTVCRPACEQLPSARRTLELVVGAPAVPPTDDPRRWIVVLLLAAAALLVGVAASAGRVLLRRWRRLREPDDAARPDEVPLTERPRVLLLPEPRPDVRLEVEPSPWTRPPLRLRARRDHHPEVVLVADQPGD